jgi:hypothetical protein
MLQPLQTSANESTLALPIASFLLPNKTLLASLTAHFDLRHSVSLQSFGDGAAGDFRTLLYVLRLNGIDFGGWLFTQSKTVVLQPMALTNFGHFGLYEDEGDETVLLGTCVHDSSTPALLIKYESVPLASLGLFGPLPDGNANE